MKTDDLIEGLSRDLKPVRRGALALRFGVTIAAGLAVSILAMLLILGPRPDIAKALSMPEFWIKSLYNALLAVTGIVALYRLSRPGGNEGSYFTSAGTILALMGLVAATQLWVSPQEDYQKLIIGGSALDCPFLILGFSLPIAYANIRLLRGAAPTDLGRAGLIAGLAAGAAGAWVYSWFCDENGMAFVLIWYTLSIALLGVIGAALGRRLLRW